VRGDGDPERLRIVDGRLPLVASSSDNDPAEGPRPVPGGGISGVGGVDVVFPVLHGPYGEDGTVQGLLELIGLPYVGSGVLASAVAMDKGAMKRMLRDAGLPVGPFEVVTDAQWRRERAACVERAEALGYPMFVKPIRAGSSRGIAKARTTAELEAAIDAARAHDPHVIVEASIEQAREIECGVLGGDAPRASRCAEIIVRGHEFYDFDAKYLDDSAELIVPAALDGAVEDAVRQLAIDSFVALGCEGLARVDFFVTAAGEILVNEVNTMPGFTPISMFPRMWAATGVDYPTLITTLIDDALTRGTGLR
jgi:D-alanine-D-alanine ligase